MRLKRTLGILALAGVLVLPSFAFADDAEDWFIAAKNNRTYKLKTMLQEGFDVNTVEQSTGNTGLILACLDNSEEAAELLLKNKRTNVNAIADNGNNALMLAAWKENLKLVKLLIERGADVNKDGWTPLHYAAAQGSQEIVAELLKHDAFVNAVSPNGTTPIMMAARAGHAEVVADLIKAGADLTIVNQRGYTAKSFALEHKNPKIAKKIEKMIEEEEKQEEIKNRMPNFPF